MLMTLSQTSEAWRKIGFGTHRCSMFAQSEYSPWVTSLQVEHLFDPCLLLLTDTPSTSSLAQYCEKT